MNDNLDDTQSVNLSTVFEKKSNIFDDMKQDEQDPELRILD